MDIKDLAMMGAFWGGLSALSLPLGAALGLWTRPPRKVVSGLMAFGAGALLFALTIELFGHALHKASDGHGHITQASLVVTTMIGAIVGGLLFEGLNQLLSKRGAAVRHRALLKKHVNREKRKKAERLLKVISRNQVLQVLDGDDTVRLTQFVDEHTYGVGDVLFNEGDEADAVYFITKGKVLVEHEGENGKEAIATLGPGDVLGEIALVSDAQRGASARAESKLEVLTLTKAEFADFLGVSVALKNAVAELASKRFKELVEKQVIDAEIATRWEEEHLSGLKTIAIHTSDEEIAEAAEEHGHGGSASAIWLGIALDGIPESLVIGMLVAAAAATGNPMSYAFVIGVFLANLPEAMSSAVTMRVGGMSIKRIMVMWGSLCVMTAVGGLVGAAFLDPHPEGWTQYAVFGMEGLAAGAMLTMIAETMLPEAFEQGGGTIAGLSTLVGFLAALSVKLI